MLILLLDGRYLLTRGGLVRIFLREVLTKRCNVLRRSETDFQGSRGFSRQDLDVTRYLVLHRISVRKSTAAVGYKYYTMHHYRIWWNLVEHDEKMEHEAVRENCLEEIDLSAGITKVMNIVMTNKESYPTQDGKSRRGTGVGASWEKGVREKCWEPRENTYRSSRYWQSPKENIRR